MRLIVFSLIPITVTAPSLALDEYWMPVVDGEFWSIAGNPDLGKYTSKRQAPVDFAVWQASDGTWQLWSCIRSTKCGGFTRLFHRWEGKNLTDSDWKPMGIAMEAKPELGEMPGGMQAPHVIKHNGLYWMAYGDRVNICFATSKDGKHFDRVIQPNGITGVFSEGPVQNTRDAMLTKIGNLWHCYYTASDPLRLRGYIFCRTSENLKNWSQSVVVNAGGYPDIRRTNAECPHVIEVEPGWFCLFRNHKYGRNALFSVYYSDNPLNFGINHNQKRVCTMPYAAPEVIYHQGKYYLAVLKPRLDGIRIARLKWIKYRSKGKNIFDFDNADIRRQWKLIEGDIHSIFTTHQPENICLPMFHYIGTAELDVEKRDDKQTGIIESPPFTLTDKRYTLFVSGGNSPENLYVALVDDKSDQEIKRLTGKGSDILNPIIFESGPSRGKQVRLRIVDRDKGKLGHINFGGIYAHKALAEK